MRNFHLFFAWLLILLPYAHGQTFVPANPSPLVLHAARLFDVEAGRIITPGELLVAGDRILEAGSSVKHPADAKVIDLGDTTLMPGLIDAHVHSFLHPGAEDMQTVMEPVSERTILATLAAKADLIAVFTAERDMGTEGAGPADSAVRDAIKQGLILGRGCGLAGMQFPFWVATRTRSTSIRRNTCCQTRIAQTTPSNSSRQFASSTRRDRAS